MQVVFYGWHNKEVRFYHSHSEHNQDFAFLRFNIAGEHSSVDINLAKAKEDTAKNLLFLDQLRAEVDKAIAWARADRAETQTEEEAEK